MKIEKEVSDVRGKIMFMSYDKKQVNIVEIKKGYARGGHYHPFASDHIVITGRIEYREENIETQKEEIKIIESPYIIQVPPRTAHLLIALEDSIFAEVFEREYEGTNYPKYRKIVEEKMAV